MNIKTPLVHYLPTTTKIKIHTLIIKVEENIRTVNLLKLPVGLRKTRTVMII